MFTRRELFKVGALYAAVAIGALSWDVGVNGGKPAKDEGDDEEPPQ